VKELFESLDADDSGQVTPHHQTFSTTIHPPYSSTKGCII
jgi:hypothetical protein